MINASGRDSGRPFLSERRAPPRRMDECRGEGVVAVLDVFPQERHCDDECGVEDGCLWRRSEEQTFYERWGSVQDVST